MPVFEAQDKAGNTFNVMEINGKWFPPEVSEDILKNIPNVTVRQDDIFVCGYLRSGTHWTFEMIHMLMSGNAETVPLWKRQQMLEYTAQSDLEAQPTPRVLNNHLHYSELPKDVPTLSNKIVYLLRDPRDVAVSYYRVLIDEKTDYKADWASYLDSFICGDVFWGSWFDHVNSWESLIDNNQHKDILVVYYEDTHKDRASTVQRLSDFLGLQTNQSLISQIADKCAFNRMVVDKEKYAYIVDGKNIMYRKGVVGDWKNWFTVAQSEMFEKELRKRVGSSRLVHRYLH